MFLLLFFISLILLFTYWIFVPVTIFLTHVLEIRPLPVISLLIFIFLFSAKDKN